MFFTIYLISIVIAWICIIFGIGNGSRDSFVIIAAIIVSIPGFLYLIGVLGIL